MKTMPSMKLTQEGCDIIVNAAIEKAKELKQVVSICVVDAGGHLMAFKRMTNGRTHNTLICQAKARSAALTTAATGKTGRDGSEIPDHQVLGANARRWPGVVHQYRRRAADCHRRSVHRCGRGQWRSVRGRSPDRPGGTRRLQQSLGARFANP